MKLFLAICILLVLATSTATAKRPHVVIPKPLPVIKPTPLQAAGALAVVAPPLLVFYDLQRRITCMNPPDPLGLGGPGFDGKPTPPSNIMVPACLRR
jgi:hypothetical protein